VTLAARVVSKARSLPLLMKYALTALRLLLAVLLLVGVAQVAQANDILFVPIADTHPQGQMELQAVYINQPATFPPGSTVLLQNGYYGVTDRLELSWHAEFGLGAAPALPPVQANVAYKLLASNRPDRPTVTIGAYNVTGVGGAPFFDYAGVEPYIVMGHNLFLPDRGKPDWDDPLVRVNVGVGTSAHRTFGNIIVVPDEDLAFVAQYHNQRWSLIGHVMFGDKNQYHLTPFIWNGAPGVKVAYVHNF